MDLSKMTDEELYKLLRVARREKQVIESRIIDYANELEDRANARYERQLAVERDAWCRCPYDVPCTCQPEFEE